MINTLLTLEGLAIRPTLVAPIEYQNLPRSELVFREFVREYASSLGIEVVEKRTGFLDEWKVGAAYLKRELFEPVTNIGRLAFDALQVCDLLTLSVSYPLLGSAGFCAVGENIIKVFGIEVERDTILVGIPKYDGLLSFVPKSIYSTIAHEYLHLYHYALAKDLRQRGLLSINGISDVGMVEPSWPTRTPSPEDLKKFERQCLRAIILEQERQSTI